MKAHRIAYATPIPQALRPSGFYIAYLPIFPAWPHLGGGTRDGVMLFYPTHEERLGRLQARLRQAQTVTPQLMSDIVAQACGRIAARSGAAPARVDRLIESAPGPTPPSHCSNSSCRSGSFVALSRRTVNGTARSRNSRLFPLGSMRPPKPATKFCRWRSCSRSS